MPQNNNLHSARNTVWRRPKNRGNLEMEPTAVVLLDTLMNNSSMVQPNDALVTEQDNINLLDLDNNRLSRRTTKLKIFTLTHLNATAIILG